MTDTNDSNGGKKYLEDKKWITKSLERHDYLLEQLNKGQTDLMKQMVRVAEGVNNVTSDIREIKDQMVTRAECDKNHPPVGYDTTGVTGRIFIGDRDSLLFDKWSKRAKLILLILSILGMLGISSGINYAIQHAASAKTRNTIQKDGERTREEVIKKAVEKALKESK